VDLHIPLSPGFRAHLASLRKGRNRVDLVLDKFSADAHKWTVIHRREKEERIRYLDWANQLELMEVN